MIEVDKIYNAEIDGEIVPVKVQLPPQPFSQLRCDGISPSIDNAEWYCKVIRLDNDEEIILKAEKLLAKRD